MTTKTYYNCKDLYQRDVGATWKNLDYARTGDNRASYVYPKGSKSKNEYKPKDIVYRYATSFTDPSLWTVDASTFTVVFGKYKIKENAIPKIRVYTGKKGNNTFIREVTAYTKKDNVWDADTYTIQYNLGKLTPQQWNKGIMIKLMWDKTKTTKESTISINRARCSVKYHKNTSKIAIYSSLSDNINTKDGAVWSLTVKNTGDCDATALSVDIPYGAKLIDLGGDGVWDSSEYPDELFFNNICNGQSKTHKFRVIFPYEGIFELSACNTWNENPVNLCVFELADVHQYIPPDGVAYKFYPAYEKEDGYFDMMIFGGGTGHKYNCYNVTLPDNIQVAMPIRETFEDDVGNVNVEEVNRNSHISYEYNGRTIDIDLTDGMICVKVDDVTANFEAHIRIPFKAVREGVGTISTHSAITGKDYDDTITILPKRNNLFTFNCEFSQDKSFVQNSINIGIPEIWSLRCKSSRHNLFVEKKSDLQIVIEKLIAYIGCIPLSRSHKADVTSDVTNTLIDTRYLNRRYLGKEGNYLEKIGMTLRMHWTDVATLKGLLEMDKPIPVDTCPELPDGDPLNHRGWVELSAVKSIKKINDMLYECQPEVDYITHKLLTKFSIQQRDKLTTTEIEYYLSETLNYTDDLTERFNVSYYGFFTNLEDDFGNYMGSYDIPASANLKFNTNKKLNDYSTYGLKFRNTLPSLMSEDYDNNWEMALRVKDKNSQQVLFEHIYNNFKHYDFGNSQVLNVADVTSKVFDGTNFNILNFDRISLGYGDVASLLEDKRTVTHFNSLDDTVFDADNENFEVFLLDSQNNGLPNEKVIVNVTSDAGYINTFNVMTDIFGRIIFPVNFGNGDYTIELAYDGSNDNRQCIYSVDVTVNYDEVALEFEYSDNVVATDVGQEYSFIVLNGASPISNIMVHYSFRDSGSDSYGYERTATSDAEGMVTVPLDWTNGTKMLKVSMKGFVDNGTMYQPVGFEQEVNINILKEKTLIIEADDVELLQGDSKKDYFVKVSDSNGNLLEGKELIFGIYNKQENYVMSSTTNEQGVASIPLYLAGDSWHMDVHFKGDDSFNPSVVSREINIRKFERTGTSLSSQNLHINENMFLIGAEDYYTLTLTDDNGNAVADEPIRAKVYGMVDGESELYVDVVLKTDDDGKIKVPFISHSEDVTIVSEYKGCIRYSGCERSDVVSFDDIDSRIGVSFNATSTNLQIKKGNGAWSNIESTLDTVSRVIVNYPDDDISSHEGMYYYQSMNSNTYQITLMYKGNSNYYSYARTLTFVKTNDTRESKWGWAELLGLDELIDNITATSDDKGALNHITLKCDYELPREMVYLGMISNNTSTAITVEELEAESDYVVGTMPRYIVEDGVSKTVMEWDVVNPTEVTVDPTYVTDYNCQVKILQDVNDYVVRRQLDEPPLVPTFTWEYDMELQDVDKDDSILAQNGFGYLGYTYQSMDISSTSPYAGSREKVNDYYIMKLLNTDTFEEFYFYSYFVDNVTPSHMEFLLGLGTWEMWMVSKDTEEYNGAYYTTTVELTEESRYNHIDDFFYDYDNWNEYGLDDIIIDGSSISAIDSNTTIAITNEFTESNKYELVFKVEIPNISNGSFLICADQGGSEYLQVRNGHMALIKNGSLIDEKIIANNITGDWKVKREGNKIDVFFDNQLIYSTTELVYNTFGIMFGAITVYGLYVIYEPTAEITPAVDDYDGTVFGSNIDLSLKKNVLSLIDYGMLPEGDYGAGKVILKNVPLLEGEYELETDIIYNNSRFERLNNLEGLIQYRILEDALTSDTELNYGNIICSPVPLQNSITRFTRMTDEGRMYFAEPSKEGAKYLCNPYLQYKGGTDLKSETGISLFSLDGGFSPVFLSNGLVRAEFHRYSGYIKVSRFDEKTEDWFVCQVFHLHDEPNLELVDSYSDDKATVMFGNTKWTMWRGRPFIRVEHENDDLRMLNLVDRVYCETIDNEFNMGFIEEHDTTYSVFNPQMSTQQFSQELHIGEDIRLDNFDLCLVDAFSNEYYDADHTSTITTKVVDNENAIDLKMNLDPKISVIFPSDAYVKKPNSTFSLLIGYLVQHNIDDLKVKARGYGDNGKVKEKEEYQYGVWEEIHTVDLGEQGEPDEIRVTFKNVPDNVKYIDFMLIFTGDDGDAVFKQLMLYEGDANDGENENNQAYDIDRTLANAVRTEIAFNETYYACLYDNDSPSGLAICRPTKQSFTLRSLTRSKETLLIPYMKNYSEYDDVAKVFLEYLNSKDQVVNVEWRE